MNARPLSNDYITRGEYENRLSVIEQRLNRAEERHERLVESKTREHTEIRTEIQNSVDRVESIVQNLKDDISRERKMDLRSMIGYAITFVAGSGLISIIQFFLHH